MEANRCHTAVDVISLNHENKGRNNCVGWLSISFWRFCKKVPLLVVRLILFVSTVAILGLLASLLWYLTSIAYRDALNNVGDKWRDQIVNQAVANCATCIGTMSTALNAYSTLLTPLNITQADTFDSFTAQVRPVTYNSYKILGNQSTVSVARQDGTFVSFYSSLDTESVMLDQYGFWNTTAQIDDFFYASSVNKYTGQTTGNITTSSFSSLGNGELFDLNGNNVGLFPGGGSWKIVERRGSGASSGSFAVVREVANPETGTIWGVASVSLPLQLLTDRVELGSDDSSLLYVTSQDGYLLAASTGCNFTSSTILSSINDSTSLSKYEGFFLATQSLHPLLQASAAKISEVWNSSINGSKEHTHHKLNWEGKSYIVETTKFSAEGLDLVAVLVFPRESFLGGTHRINQLAIILLVLGTAVILVLGVGAIACCTGKAEGEEAEEASKGSGRGGRKGGSESSGKKLRLLGGRRRKVERDYKAQFMANMSHELRTPMAGIIGLMDILQSDDSLSEEQTEIVGQIRRCAMALLGILNNILDLSKVEEGKLELEAVPFDPCAELESLVEMFAVQCGTAGVDIGLDLSDDMPSSVAGDCTRYRQIFANLLSNSIKFTSNGWIRIRGWVVLPQPEQQVHHSSSHRGSGSQSTLGGIISSGSSLGRHGRRSHDAAAASVAARDSQNVVLYFEIEDTGLGIDPAQWESVFENFVQGDASSTRKYGGSGLGLSLTRAFVEAMDGSIHVAPKVNGTPGTRITFQITLQGGMKGRGKGEEEAEAEAAAAAAGGGGGGGGGGGRGIQQAESDSSSTVLSPGAHARVVTRLLLPSASSSSSASSPPSSSSVVLLCMPRGINLSLVEDWLARRGLRDTIRQVTSWADTVLYVEEWGRSVRQSRTATSSSSAPLLLVLVDFALLPGMNKLPADPAEIEAYMGRLRAFHKRGAHVACLLSPHTPFPVRSALRDSSFAFVASKPLYASKVWRLLQAMVQAEGEEEEEEGEGRKGKRKSGDIGSQLQQQQLQQQQQQPLQQSLQQDMLVAQGTGVHLAVEAARLDMSLSLASGHVLVPGEGDPMGGAPSLPVGPATSAVFPPSPTPLSRRVSGCGSSVEGSGVFRFSGEMHAGGSAAALGHALLVTGIEHGLNQTQTHNRRHSATAGTAAAFSMAPEALMELMMAHSLSHEGNGRGAAGMTGGRFGLQRAKSEKEAALLKAMGEMNAGNGIHSDKNGAAMGAVQGVKGAVVDGKKGGGKKKFSLYHSAPAVVPLPGVTPLYSHLPPLSPSKVVPAVNAPTDAAQAAALHDSSLRLTPPSAKASAELGFDFSSARSHSNPVFNSTNHSNGSNSSPEVTAGAPAIEAKAAAVKPSSDPNGADFMQPLLRKLERRESAGEALEGGGGGGSERNRAPIPILSAVTSPADTPAVTSPTDTPAVSSAAPSPLRPPSASANSSSAKSSTISTTTSAADPASGDSTRRKKTPTSPWGPAADSAESTDTYPDSSAPSASSVMGSHPSAAALSRRRSLSEGTEPVELVAAALKAEEEKKKLQPPAPPAPLTGMRLLVAEDTAVLRRLAVALLQKLGAVVSAVNDGQAAVEAVAEAYEKAGEEGGEEHRIDAVIMDCQMPRLDGYSATKAIRIAEKSIGKHIPIIALTAHAMASDKERCLDCGMDAYLTKPANKTLLVETLQKFVVLNGDK